MHDLPLFEVLERGEEVFAVAAREIEREGALLDELALQGLVAGEGHEEARAAAELGRAEELDDARVAELAEDLGLAREALVVLVGEGDLEGERGDDQRRREDYAATCCAIQNIQLAAWAEGVGVKWSTAAVIHDPLAYRWLDIEPQSYDLIALLYVGYPADIPVRERKRPLTEIISYTD